MIQGTLFDVGNSTLAITGGTGLDCCKAISHNSKASFKVQMEPYTLVLSEKVLNATDAQYISFNTISLFRNDLCLVM